MIAVIDYDMGNLRSVINGLKEVGGDPFVTNEPDKIRKAQGIVLPGVGAFGDGLKNLKKYGLPLVLREEVLEKGKPFLGICLGLQLLAEKSQEFGEHQGLGWVKGEVVRIVPEDSTLKVPHMGWNSVDIKIENNLYRGLPPKPAFYFLHSYHLIPDDKSIISGTCNHGGELTASITFDNISAVQFHPEKSQKEGLRLLKNFVMQVKENC